MYLSFYRKILTQKPKVPVSDEVTVETCTSTIQTGNSKCVYSFYFIQTLKWSNSKEFYSYKKGVYSPAFFSPVCMVSGGVSAIKTVGTCKALHVSNSADLRMAFGDMFSFRTSKKIKVNHRSPARLHNCFLIFWDSYLHRATSFLLCLWWLKTKTAFLVLENKHKWLNLLRGNYPIFWTVRHIGP